LLKIKFGSIIWFDFSNQWAIQRMNQVTKRFANQLTIERRVSQLYLTLTSKETSLLPHFSWLLRPSQTTMPYPSMTSLLLNFSWLLHPSQMNVQKAHQRRQLNVQWTTPAEPIVHWRCVNWLVAMPNEDWRGELPTSWKNCFHSISWALPR
jgi:hypothetical protein